MSTGSSSARNLHLSQRYLDVDDDDDYDDDAHDDAHDDTHDDAHAYEPI